MNNEAENLTTQDDEECEPMGESRPKIGPGEISRFRAIVVATLRAKQLRRGAKPRFELGDEKHKDTCIAMEEVRRGLIAFTQFAEPHCPAPRPLGDLKAGVEQSLPVVG